MINKSAFQQTLDAIAHMPDGSTTLDQAHFIWEQCEKACAPQWQTMDSAPKDGTEILGFWSYTYDGDKHPTVGFCVISWSETLLGGGWEEGGSIAGRSVYKYWMPLPSAPEVPA